MYDINEFVKEQTQENKDDEKNAQKQGNADNQIKKDNSKKIFTIDDLQPF